MELQTRKHGQPLPLLTAATDEDEEGKIAEDLMKVNPLCILHPGGDRRRPQARDSFRVARVALGRCCYLAACVVPQVPLPPSCVMGSLLPQQVRSLVSHWPS